MLFRFWMWYIRNSKYTTSGFKRTNRRGPSSQDWLICMHGNKFLHNVFEHKMSNVIKNMPPMWERERELEKRQTCVKKCIAFIVLGIEHPVFVSFIMQVIQPIDFIEPEFHFNKFIYVSWGHSIIIDMVGLCCGHWLCSKKKLSAHFTSNEYWIHLRIHTKIYSKSTASCD